MATIFRSAFVPFSSEQMFDLVNNIEQYPEFLPWCPNTEVISRSQEEIKATVHFAKGALAKSFTTVNRLLPHARVEMRLLKGPFRHLEGLWEFQNIENQGSRVTLNLSFEFNNKLLAFALGPLFHQMASTMVESFSKRAHQVYAG
jgi:ribosome-associated toxin RatA of RatAB toxin-antitoxin module